MNKSRKSSTSMVSLEPHVTAATHSTEGLFYVFCCQLQSHFDDTHLFLTLCIQKSQRRILSVKLGWWSNGLAWLKRETLCWYLHLVVASLELLQTGKKKNTLPDSQVRFTSFAALCFFPPINLVFNCLQDSTCRNGSSHPCPLPGFEWWGRRSFYVKWYFTHSFPQALHVLSIFCATSG